MTANEQLLIDYVRNSKTCGRGTCSVIDECWTDQELLQAWREANITTRTHALTWAVRVHKSYEERRKEVRSYIF